MPKKKKTAKPVDPSLPLAERAARTVELLSPDAKDAMKGACSIPKITAELRHMGCLGKRSNARTSLGLEVSKQLGGDTAPRHRSSFAAVDGSVVSRSPRTKLHA